MINSWLSLLPPLIVVAAAGIFRRIHPALLAGIATACLIVSHGSISQASQLALNSFINTASSIDNLLVYAFLIAVGTLVALFNQTGSATSFCKAIIQKIRSARMTQYTSITISFLLFIDDYLSILTTGYVMRPLIDEFRISRLKLAFLIHSLAGTVVILAPVSSWVATITTYINQAGVDSEISKNIRILADPFYIYLRSVPFMFYSFLVIFSVWFIVNRNISYGPMKEHEQDVSNGSLDGPEKPRWLDLLLPLFTLIMGIIIGLPLAGGYWLFGGSHGFVEAIKYNDHPFLVMFLSASSACIISFIIGLLRKSVAFSQIPQLIGSGFRLMYSAIGMVYLATTLSGLLADDVGTGQYLASILLGSIPLFLIPCMFYIVSLICTLASGSAWGSFALMLPIAIPMITSLSGLPLPVDPTALPLLFPVLGAIFSGSVCGDHISPVSETTIMTATCTNTNFLLHTITQFWYILPAVVSTFIAFLIAGFTSLHIPNLSAILSLTVGILLTATSLLVLNRKA